MAEPVISFFVERIGDALIAEAIFLHGVTKQVKMMEDELKRMQCFLKDADAKKDGDVRISNRVSEIRDLAYHAEDVIDTFIIKVVSKRREGFQAFLKRYACIFTESVERHKIGAEIEDIYKKIQNITGSLQTYGVRNIDEGEGSSNAYQMQQRLRRSYPHFKEEDVIGLEEDTNKMVEELIREEERYRVVSIVGMGGTGKTTLAKEVYNHRRVKIAFDCYSWVYVSQEFKPKDILTSILKNVSSLDRETLEKMKEEALVGKLYEILKEKRYLVVLDDIWSEDAWDTKKLAFPNGMMGSKILLTTRKENVALHADPRSVPCKPRSLTDDESWELLCKKAFPEDGVPSFEKLGREMISRCGNLPLAIVVLGGLLARKRSLKEWELVNRHITGHLTGHLSEGQQQNKVMDILGISYHDLPSQLKPCFLYFGLFPEDFQIRAEKLIQLWVAEGFIPKPPPIT